MKVLGFSINTLTLFGLTLATGLVVDDAIVVIENIARFIQEKGMSPLEGAREAMREITGAVARVVAGAAGGVRSGRVLPGDDRPALQAVRADDRVLDHHLAVLRADAHAGALVAAARAHRPRRIAGSSGRSTARSPRPAGAITARCRSCCAAGWLVLGVFAVLLAAHGLGVHLHADRLHPRRGPRLRDHQPAAARGRLDRLHASRAARRREQILNEQPEITDVFDAAGFSFTGNGSNKATMFIRLRPWGERPGTATCSTP